MSKYELYLNDILRAIKKIEVSLKNKTEKQFSDNVDLIDATTMRIQIIGESAYKMPKEIKQKYKEIEWDRFVKSRNLISHAYFAVNPKIIWSIVKQDIPKLKIQIKKIKKQLK